MSGFNMPTSYVGTTECNLSSAFKQCRNNQPGRTLAGFDRVQPAHAETTHSTLVITGRKG